MKIIMSKEVNGKDVCLYRKGRWYYVSHGSTITYRADSYEEALKIFKEIN